MAGESGGDSAVWVAAVFWGIVIILVVAAVILIPSLGYSCGSATPAGTSGGSFLVFQGEPIPDALPVTTGVTLNWTWSASTNVTVTFNGTLTPGPAPQGGVHGGLTFSTCGGQEIATVHAGSTTSFTWEARW